MKDTKLILDILFNESPLSPCLSRDCLDQEHICMRMTQKSRIHQPTYISMYMQIGTISEFLGWHAYRYNLLGTGSATFFFAIFDSGINGAQSKHLAVGQHISVGQYIAVIQ